MNYRSKNCSLALHSHYVIGAWIFVSIRFSQRLLLLDEQSDLFLRTLLYLGGYCTIEQAQKLGLDRKSTRLNSSHITISYAVFCLKKKNDALTIQHDNSDRYMDTCSNCTRVASRRQPTPLRLA